MEAAIRTKDGVRKVIMHVCRSDAISGARIEVPRGIIIAGRLTDCEVLCHNRLNPEESCVEILSTAVVSGSIVADHVRIMAEKTFLKIIRAGYMNGNISARSVTIDGGSFAGTLKAEIVNISRHSHIEPCSSIQACQLNFEDGVVLDKVNLKTLNHFNPFTL